jgi:quinol monooxygenase YgiN
MIIEITDIDVKPDCVERLAAKIAEFRSILLSLPGGIAARCLQDESDPTKFAFFTQWESTEAKDLFMSDPRLQAWASEYPDLIVGQTDRYFVEYS